MDSPASDNKGNDDASRAPAHKESRTDVSHDRAYDELASRLDRLWDNPSSNSSSAGAANVATGLPLQSGRVAHYDLERVLGSGAFGVVYLARDTQLNRQVALKLPRPEVLIDPVKRKRFASEATLAARLDHPCIVPVYAAELAGPAPHIVTAYCDGPDLAEWIEHCGKATRWEDAANLVASIADAMHHAHESGVYHRDLKPANILLVQRASDAPLEQLSEYQPLVTDFGLSKLADGCLTDTRSSLLVGSPLYMAPEQIDRESLPGHEAAADIYSLGVILFELLTGRPPIEGESYVEVLDSIRSQPATRLRELQPNLPRDLEHICRRCLEKNPAARYPTAAALADDLRTLASEGQIAGESLGWAARLRYWCTRPARITQAGWFAVWTQSIWLFWVLFTGTVGQVFAPVSYFVHSYLYVEMAMVILMAHLPLVVVGWYTAGRRPWAPWVGLGLSLFQLPGMLYSLFVDPLVFADLYSGSNWYFRFLIYSMLLTCFAIHALLFGCAVAAMRRLKETKTP